MSNPVTKVHERGQEPVGEDHAVIRAYANARFRDRDASLAWCRSCHNGPTSATSPAIRTADRPVILRPLMIALRIAFPSTQP